MQWDSGGLQTSQCNAIKMQVQPKNFLKTQREDAGKQQRVKE